MDNDVKELLPHSLEVLVSPDKMTAIIKVLSINNSCPLEPELVIEKLENEGISHGICKPEIEEFCHRGKYYLKLKAAVGTPPIQGEDGVLDFHFETTRRGLPKENPDGTIDYKDLDLIHNVLKDQILCTIIPPKQGIDGITIFGETVPAQVGREAHVKHGKNTYISEDESKIYSKTSGNVRYEKGTILVDDVYLIDGDVGPTTGNITFEGTVKVTGHVLEGFHIDAKEDILIKGRVEGCSLTAGRNIMINDGVNGMKKGLIKAEGDVTCKFVETGNVICGGDFRCDVALSSTVDAGKSIIVKGERASLIGGDYSAGKSIIVRNVGSEKNIPVNLRINPQWEIEKTFLEDELHEITEEIEAIDEEIEELRRFDNLSATVAQKTVSIHRNLTRKDALVNELTKIRKKLEDIKDQKHSPDYRIVCTGKVFDGVKITIGQASMRIMNTISHQSFYLSDGEIVAGMVLPNEG